MTKEADTVNRLIDLSRRLWSDNSTEFLAGALQSVTTDKQMQVLINHIEEQINERGNK